MAESRLNKSHSQSVFLDFASLRICSRIQILIFYADIGNRLQQVCRDSRERAWVTSPTWIFKCTLACTSKSASVLECTRSQNLSENGSKRTHALRSIKKREVERRPLNLNSNIFQHRQRISLSFKRRYFNQLSAIQIMTTWEKCNSQTTPNLISAFSLT